LEHLEKLVKEAKESLSPSPRRPSSPLDDLDDFLRGLPQDERKLVEKNEECIRARNIMCEAFIFFMLLNSSIGQEFSTGSGLIYSQNVLDTARSVHKDIAGKVMTEKELLAKKVELLEQQNQILKNKLGGNSNVG